jgi:hypothetical protein
MIAAMSLPIGMLHDDLYDQGSNVARTALQDWQKVLVSKRKSDTRAVLVNTAASLL